MSSRRSHRRRDPAELPDDRTPAERRVDALVDYGVRLGDVEAYWATVPAIPRDRDSDPVLSGSVYLSMEGLRRDRHQMRISDHASRSWPAGHDSIVCVGDLPEEIPEDLLARIRAWRERGLGVRSAMRREAAARAAATRRLGRVTAAYDRYGGVRIRGRRCTVGETLSLPVTARSGYTSERTVTVTEAGPRSGGRGWAHELRCVEVSAYWQGLHGPPRPYEPQYALRVRRLDEVAVGDVLSCTTSSIRLGASHRRHAVVARVVEVRELPGGWEGLAVIDWARTRLAPRPTAPEEAPS